MQEQSFPYNSFKALLGTTKEMPEASQAAPADGDKELRVTVTLRRQRSLDEALKNGVRMTREEFDVAFGIPEDRFEAVGDFARYFKLGVVETDRARRSVTLSGKVCDFEAAFLVGLEEYTDGHGGKCLGYTGAIFVPEEMVDIIEGVFGLDTQADIQALLAFAHSITPTYKSVKGYYPAEVAEVYGFPKDVTGKAQCIAIIELGGGYRQEDIEKYYNEQGMPVPDVSWVGVDGAFNAPTRPDSFDKEVMMNIEVAGAIACGARIVAYFAPNTDKGFLNAITTAIHDKINRPSVISISWGAPEKKWTRQSLNIYNEAFKVAAILGITVCVATGNGGTKDGVKDDRFHVDFPASSPYVLACGGTRLLIRNKKVISEVAWFQSHHIGGGGGVSEFFPLPEYQESVNVPASINTNAFKGRGLPDVAGNADPATGYKILVHGTWHVISGTSSVAPLYAGLIALLNEQKGRDVGFINPQLYANPSLCRNISQGDFYANHVPVYRPRKGWDACTGLGVLSKVE